MPKSYEITKMNNFATSKTYFTFALMNFTSTSYFSVATLSSNGTNLFILLTKFTFFTFNIMVQQQIARKCLDINKFLFLKTIFRM